MNADFKQKVNDFIENIFDDDDFVNDVVDSNNISEFMKFFAQYGDKVVDSSGQEAFCYAVFKILQDNFSLEDLRKNSDIVPPGYYFAYCIEKNVKDINLVGWKGGWDHYTDSYFSFWYGYSDLKNIQLDRLTVDDDILLCSLINALFDAKSGLDSGHINTLLIVDDVGNQAQFNFPDSKDFTIDNVILDNSSHIDVSGLNIKTLSLSNTIIPVFRWDKWGRLDYIDITDVDSDNSGVIVLPPWFISMLLNSDTKILLDHGQKLRVQKIFTAKIKERLQYK